jgi:CheY-like chemotaxis protein
VRASVLVVDDDPLQRAIICEVLCGRSYDCAEASDGDLALASLTRAPADVVVIDMLMDRKDGVETIIEIRKRWPAIRIIAISGGGHSLDSGYLLDTARALGAHAALRKPIDRIELRSLVEDLLADAAADRGRD